MTENQINEMFRLMTTTIKKIDGLENKFDKKIDDLENRFDGLENRFDNLENRFDNLENKFEQSEETNSTFRAETKQVLGEIKQELRFMNRKIDVQIEDLTNTKVKIRDHEERLRVLEEKDVA